jgi:hypothetical protein
VGGGRLSLDKNCDAIRYQNKIVPSRLSPRVFKNNIEGHERRGHTWNEHKGIVVKI